MKNQILGIDIGTSACKIAVFDEDGRVIASTNKEYKVYYPNPGWVEQDAEEWWEAVCCGIKEVLLNPAVDTSSICCIGIDGQSWSAIPVDKDGNVLGKHKGIIHYTVGQRKGLGIAAAAPLYVLSIDSENNKVVLGSNEDLFSRELEAENVNWISGEMPDKPFKAFVRVRYHGKKEPCIVTPSSDGFSVLFDEPVRAITPGQSAVIYSNDQVLGGGIIKRK